MCYYVLLCLKIIVTTIYFMDRWFIHSNIHKLIQYIRTWLPCIREYDQIRSGLRLTATNDELINAALDIINRLSGSKQKKEPFDKEKALQLLKQIEDEFEHKYGDNGNANESKDDDKDDNDDDDNFFIYGDNVDDVDDSQIINGASQIQERDLGERGRTFQRKPKRKLHTITYYYILLHTM